MTVHGRWYVVRTTDRSLDEHGVSPWFEIMDLDPRFEAFDLLADGYAAYVDGPWSSQAEALAEVTALNCVLEILEP